VWVGALIHTTRAVVAWRRAGAAVRWVLTRYMRLDRMGGWGLRSHVNVGCRQGGPGR